MYSIGDLIDNRYEIKEPLGSGSGGTVFKAWDKRMKKDVAIKRLADSINQENARREVDVLKEIKQNNLPIVIDYIEDDTGYYTVMDFISGDNMKSLYQKRSAPWTEKQVCEYMIELCDAVQYLHSKKPPIIHSDIKPANIMLTNDDHITLIDFNISSAEADGKAVSKGGTKGFAAPEQFRQTIATPDKIKDFHEETRFLRGGGKQTAYIDIKTDIYGMGATMFWLITGKTPTNGTVDVREYEFSPAISKIIGRATAADPVKRYKSAEDMRNEIVDAKKTAKSTRIKRLYHKAKEKSKNTIDSDTTVPVKQYKRNTISKLIFLPITISLICIVAVVVLLTNNDLVKSDDQDVSEYTETTSYTLSTDSTAEEYEESAAFSETVLSISVDDTSETYSQYDDQITEVPDFRGRTWDEAADIADKIGIHLIRVDEDTSDVEDGIVISQSIGHGKKIYIDKDSITLIVSVNSGIASNNITTSAEENISSFTSKAETTTINRKSEKEFTTSGTTTPPMREERFVREITTSVKTTTTKRETTGVTRKKKKTDETKKKQTTTTKVTTEITVTTTVPTTTTVTTTTTEEPTVTETTTTEETTFTTPYIATPSPPETGQPQKPDIPEIVYVN